MNVMDLNSFLDEMDNDYNDVNYIVSEFANSINTQIPLIKELIRTNDYIHLNREAHSIKGGARNIMAPGLEISAENLEKSAKLEDAKGIDQSFNSLLQEYSKFKLFLEHNLHLNVG